jgi:hypothetical protein
MNRLLVALVLVAGCATHEPMEYCEIDCPKPDSVVMHVEDLRQTGVHVSALYVTDLESTEPRFATVELVFDFSVGGLRVPGCPVLDPGLSMSLAGVPGRIKSPGGPYRGARWRCGDLILDLTPMKNAAAAVVEISDETGTVSYDLGDALMPRTVEPVGQPDWAFPLDHPSTFRWSPAADVALRGLISVSWDDPAEAANSSRQVPITHVDAATFTLELPKATSPTLWLIGGAYRSCGENCSVSVYASLKHTASTPSQN